MPFNMDGHTCTIQNIPGWLCTLQRIFWLLIPSTIIVSLVTVLYISVHVVQETLQYGHSIPALNAKGSPGIIHNCMPDCNLVFRALMHGLTQS